MAVNELIEVLLKLKEQGYGDYEVEDGDSNMSPQPYVAKYSETVYL